jgi:hypothetical protein
MTQFLTTEQVCGKLAAGGVDEATVGRVFAARLQPQKLDKDEFDRKFTMGIPARNGQVYVVVYQFGLGKPLVKETPLDEGGPDWRPRWVSVEGPFADKEVALARSRELTSA